MATVAQLGARALRKHGLAIVADASRPDGGPVLSTQEIVGRVVHALGIPVQPGDRPAEWAPVGEAEVAARALRSLGYNPIAGGGSGGGIVSKGEIVSRALWTISVNPADLPAQLTATVWTREQIGTEALRRLAIIDAQEDPSDQDLTEARKHVLATHDMLSGQGYANWHVDRVPNNVAEPYIALTANVMAPYFGKAADPALAAAAQEMVRVQALSGQTAYNRTAARVQAVHDTLVADGLADWTADSIPDGVSDAYVTMVAVAVAPIYGKALDPQSAAGAMAQVRRFVLSGPRGVVLAINAVRSAHDSLVRFGVVDWPATATPAGAADDLAMLAAAVLAPAYGAERPDPFPAVLAKFKEQAGVKDAEIRAEEKVRAVYAELNALGLVDWAYGQVPAALADAIATLAVTLMRADDGKADPAALQAGMLRVRQVAMAGPAGQRVAEAKVRAVHYDWEARGKTRWAILDIPRYAEEIYVLKAAAWLAPEVGVQANPAWEVQAEMMLSRVIALPTRGEPVQGVYF